MTADREISVARIIDGPREIVFEAYTAVEHLARWFGPRGFTTTTRAFEFRPGGVWDFIMHGPDGTDYPNWVEWLEIVPPERIVYEHGAHAGDPRSFISTLTLVKHGEATEIRLHSVFKTREQRDHVVERFHAIEAAEQTLAGLAAYVAARRSDRKAD